MAQTVDLKAKQRKQVIILAVGGVLLLGIMAIQVPKLMKSGSAPAAVEAQPATGATGAAGVAGTATSGATTPTTTPATTPSTAATSTTAAGTVAAAAAAGPSAVVAGVTISGGGPAPADGQLWSFSRFPKKDLFVPQVTEGGTAALPGSEARVPPPIDQSFTLPGGGKASSAGSSGASAASGTTGTAGPAPAAPAPPTFATIQVNGKAEQLELKQVFPASDPTFVLAALAKNVAKVGVKGGAFTSGKTVSLERGKTVTLMDTATGARYVMKLVYVGTQPEKIESFSSSPGGSQPKKK